MESKLVGYIRKSSEGGALKISLDANAMEDVERYKTRDDREFYSLTANVSKIKEIIEGDREVTSICYLVDE